MATLPDLERFTTVLALLRRVLDLYIDARSGGFDHLTAALEATFEAGVAELLAGPGPTVKATVTFTEPGM